MAEQVELFVVQETVGVEWRAVLSPFTKSQFVDRDEAVYLMSKRAKENPWGTVRIVRILGEVVPRG